MNMSTILRIRFAISILVVCLLAVGFVPTNLHSAQASPDFQAAAYVPSELILGLAEGVLVSELELPAGAALAETPTEIADQLNTFLINVPAGQEGSIRSVLLASPQVLFVEYNTRVRALLTPDDPLWPPGTIPPATALGQYGPVHVNAPEAWDLTTGSNGITVAIVDSGIDASHPEFSGRLQAGYDFVDDDSNPRDNCGHGTHVAGIAASSGDNAQGIAGINWGARIMPVRVLSYQSGNCSGDLSDVAAGIVWAVDHGADVINLSLGVTSPSMLLENATYYAYSNGVTVVAAAGNSGAAGLTYPARYPWVLSVGSTNELDLRNSNSSTGAELDLMAPGSNILSTLPTYTLTGSGRNYGTLSGTSMSAPHASAAAALLLGWDPARFDHPLKVYEALTATAQDLGAAGWDNQTGFGLLDIRLALDYLPTVIPPDPPEADVRYEWLSSRQCQNIAFSWVDATPGTVQFIT
jgi:subtilisin family serine protease